MPAAADRQLTLDVIPHPHVRQRQADELPVYMTGSLTLDALEVGRDLNAGDRVSVIVHNADGEVIASGQYEVGLPGFKALTHKGQHIGTERVHKATLIEE